MNVPTERRHLNSILCALDCLQLVFSLEVRRVFNPKQACGEMRKYVCLLACHRLVSSRPSPSHHSRPNFVSSMLLLSVISIEKRERSGLQAVYVCLMMETNLYEAFSSMGSARCTFRLLIIVSIMVFEWVTSCILF